MSMMVDDAMLFFEFNKEINNSLSENDQRTC